MFFRKKKNVFANIIVFFKKYTLKSIDGLCIYTLEGVYYRIIL